MTAHAFTLSPPAALRDLVLSRRSTRSFTDEPVPDGVLRQLLADSVWAPSPHNSQPWRFTVLTRRPDRERLAGAMASRLAEELRADGLDAAGIARQTERSQQRIVGAPAVLVCSLVDNGLTSYPDRRRNELEWLMAVQSVGAVLQTLFLLAAERGLGSCWMAAPMYCPEVVRDVLGLPDAYRPQALALLGFPAGPGRVRGRH